MPGKSDIAFKSAEGATKNGIIFVMGSSPDTDWKSSFNTCWSQNQVLANSGLQHNIQGAKLILKGIINNPQAILDELKKIAIECNKSEDDFQAKIESLKF
jgi:hypothetical protein